MDEKSRELMQEVLQDRLEKSINEFLDAEERNTAFEQAMKIADRQAKIYESDIVYDDQVKKLEHEKEKLETEKSENKKNRWVKAGEIFAVTILVPVIYYCANKGLIKEVGTVEQMEHFSGTPGRSLGKMFNFKSK